MRKNPTTHLRALRLRHNIPLTELSRASPVSHQYLSRLELQERPPTNRALAIAQAAIEAVIADRRFQTEFLAADYHRLKDQLLQIIEKEDSHVP